ncbi:two-component system regulatory protein YycI [Jeotgalibacillus sp. ET6]|uniref:two-component system regulatory protein YycI n=1 Tax=Jeotgalibacillus sp. ET6 TaxID=3037260 RepID=UPI0024188CD8|nr:two-component system regulatory protein YycI [Jeotgalibacillus sp. ET6]MDG5472374.1 two-component system regulatory protein YycI [Jeotgalibacillus sp. ET6]
MDWSKTKTIFIIVFLVLNVFLFILFLNKYEDSQLSIRSPLSADERLVEDNITFSELSNEADPQPYLNAKAYEFAQTDVDGLEQQSATVRNDILLASELTQPVDIANPSDPEELEELLDEFIIGGEDYSFWKYEEEEQRLIYYQEFEGMPIYHNITGRMVVQLNDQNQAVSYEQTMLGTIEKFPDEQDLISPREAFLEYYKLSAVEPNSEVVESELGYYSIIQLTDAASETQVLTPAWKITIEQEDGDREVHYLNAVNFSIIEIDFEGLEFERLEEIEDTVE